ncbi:MAG: hypothetical protein ACLFWB_02880 [Armatimonadota bacterium]
MRQALALLAAVAFLITAICGVCAQVADDPDLVYPQGHKFPLGLYSISSAEDLQVAGEAGWNIAQTYNMKENFLQTVAGVEGWHALAHLRGRTTDPLPQKADDDEDAAADTRGTAANTEEAGETGARIEDTERPQTKEEAGADIQRLAAHNVVAWWDFPEELRYWKEPEYDLVKNLSAWTREFDPKKRPNYMYQPGHSSAERVAKYVPYLDIIGVGTYTEYSHQPRAWVRWRIEETIRGIKLAGHEIGPDYLNGERVPIGLPMLFYSSDDRFDVITPAEAYHDFWSCIASGAKGIFVFSYWHKRDLGILQKTWERGYMRAAEQLTGGDLDQAILFGDDYPLDVEITEGSPRTVTFRPYGVDEDISFPSVNVLAKRYEGTLYIITVSSRERPVSARISGLPEGIEELRVLFEDRSEEHGGNTVPVNGGVFEDSYPHLTVHIYKAPMT